MEGMGVPVKRLHLDLKRVQKKIDDGPKKKAPGPKSTITAADVERTLATELARKRLSTHAGSEGAPQAKIVRDAQQEQVDSDAQEEDELDWDLFDGSDNGNTDTDDGL